MQFAIGHRLPFVSAPLFGDRAKFGLTPIETDPTWVEWREKDFEFYQANQRAKAGHAVNRAGYRIVRHVDLAGLDVLEIGPCDIEHIEHWRGRPRHWTNLDIRPEWLSVAGDRIEATGTPHSEVLTNGGALPFANASFDAVFSFYALEHIHPLADHLAEIARVLRSGGRLVGAIPCEGGLAWGLGRYVTSRRWLLKNTTIDPNRLICWEHPNFADFIINALDRTFTREQTDFWPLIAPSIDINLVASFIYRKDAR